MRQCNECRNYKCTKLKGNKRFPIPRRGHRLNRKKMMQDCKNYKPIDRSWPLVAVCRIVYPNGHVISV